MATPWQTRIVSKFRMGRPDECWLWLAGKSGHGYGRMREGLAHRLVWEMFVGPIDDGLYIDHLCRVRHCVNPAHLEPVTMAENLRRSPIAHSAVNARKTHCKRGHPFDEANTRWYRGMRNCRACHRTYQAEQRAKRNAVG